MMPMMAVAFFVVLFEIGLVPRHDSQIHGESGCNGAVSVSA